MLDMVKLRLFWAWHKHHWGNCCLVLEPIKSSNQLKITSYRWSCDWLQCWTMVWRCLWLFCQFTPPLCGSIVFYERIMWLVPREGGSEKGLFFRSSVRILQDSSQMLIWGIHWSPHMGCQRVASKTFLTAVSSTEPCPTSSYYWDLLLLSFHDAPGTVLCGSREGHTYVIFWRKGVLYFLVSCNLMQSFV